MHTLTNHARAYISHKQATGQFTGKTPTVTRERLALFARHHGRRPLDQLTERAVLDWLATIEHRSPATRAAYLCTVRQFCAHLVATGAIDADPCRNIPPIKRPSRVPRALPADAVRACLDACRTRREQAIIWLAVGCGLRRAEIAVLRWCDYDERARTLFVRGKAGAERVVPVPAEVAPVLAAIRGRESGPIIGSCRGDGPIQPAYVGFIVRRICREAGVKRAAYDGVSTHAFRHTAASDVLDHCGDLRRVQQMLGHAGLPSTAIYLRVANLSDVREAMEGRTYRAGEGKRGVASPGMDDGETKTCPKCAESVLAAAQVCKHCGCSFTPRAWITPVVVLVAVSLMMGYFFWNKHEEQVRSDRNVCELSAEMSGSDPSDC